MTRSKKIRAGFIALMVAAAGVLGFIALPANAATDPENPCGLSGWYTNPDESAFTPTRTFDGFVFEGKDLIHHLAPSGGIDFADMDSVVYSFAASTADKVVFKNETSAPYSTIVTESDGKMWSTAMTPGAVGGQGNPVDHYTDFLDKPASMKPGKVAFSAASEVETFGVGYWVEPGATTVTNITFHGTSYPLTCKAPVALVQARYNPSGTDIGANLVNEYVKITNKGTVPVNLAGWTVRNRAAKIYTFPAMSVNGGASVTIRTGTGVNTATNLYQNSPTAEIWKDADAATLRNSGNVTLDSCVWTKSTTGVTAC